MKKFIILFAIAAILCASCETYVVYDREGDDIVEVSLARLDAGKVFASHPYTGTAYEGESEVVTFNGKDVTIGHGSLTSPEILCHGTWEVGDNPKKIKLYGLNFTDISSGIHYSIIEGEVTWIGHPDHLYGLRLAIRGDKGEPEYDPAFEYRQEYVSFVPTVEPWSPEVIVINL